MTRALRVGALLLVVAGAGACVIQEHVIEVTDSGHGTEDADEPTSGPQTTTGPGTSTSTGSDSTDDDTGAESDDTEDSTESDSS